MTSTTALTDDSDTSSGCCCAPGAAAVFVCKTGVCSFAVGPPVPVVALRAVPGVNLEVLAPSTGDSTEQHTAHTRGGGGSLCRSLLRPAGWSLPPAELGNDK